MHDTDGGNAMTEVALALAMAFFSISILALVSMGAGGATPQQMLEAALTADNSDQEQQDSPPDADMQASTEPHYLFYWQGRFFDQDLAPAAVTDAATGQQTVLVFPPDLPFETVMRIRKETGHGNDGQEPVIAQMSPDWVTTFQTRKD